MATAVGFHTCTGPRGEVTFWPDGACSLKDGVYRSIRGAVVVPPSNMPRAAVGFDSAGSVAARKPARATEDEDALTIARLLLPIVLKMVKEEKPEGVDDMESEQEQFDSAEGAETDLSPFHAQSQAWFARARQLWANVAKRNMNVSQFAGNTGRYPSATAVATRAAKAADSVKTNAGAARQHSAFERFGV